MPKLFARAIWRFISVSRSRRLRDVEAAALLPAGREARLLLERRVELDAVAAHARRIARRARLPDETGRMPRRAAGELALLEQHDVADAELARGGRRSRRRRCRRRRRRRGRWDGKAVVIRAIPGDQSFSAATPATTLAAPARRGRPKPSLSKTAPISAANSTDVSRSAATAATGARVIAQSTMP